MSEESIEAKQQYLRSEIIDQGYNPDDFSNYMGNIRGEEGLNLETWSFADLQTVVNQFKVDMAQYQSQQQAEETNLPPQNETQNQEENQNNNYVQKGHENEDIESSIKDTTIPVEKNAQKSISKEFKFPSDPFEEYEEIIQTVKLENNEITEQNNLYITISNPQKIKNGLFSSSYFQYNVQTNPVGYNVVRKVNDFTFLYETIPIINSAVYNPILPHFEFGLKDDSPKKLLYIQNYMNSLIENKFFRTLPIVFEFLTLPQEQWNKLRLEKYSKLKPQSSLSKIPTLEGELHINISKFEDNKGLKIKDEINKKTEALDELNNAMDELLSTMDKLSLCYKSLAKSILDLTKTYKDNEILFGFFNRLLNLTKTWARNYIQEGKFLKDDFKYFFKFINKENVSFLKKYDEFKSSRDEYKSKYEKVKKLPNKTQKDLDLVKNTRKDYGLELYMVNSEYQKLIERQANRCQQQFVKYNDKKDIILQNFNNCIKLLNINENIDAGQQEGQQEHDEGFNEGDTSNQSKPEENNQE